MQGQLTGMFQSMGDGLLRNPSQKVSSVSIDWLIGGSGLAAGGRASSARISQSFTTITAFPLVVKMAPLHIGTYLLYGGRSHYHDTIMIQ